MLVRGMPPMPAPLWILGLFWALPVATQDVLAQAPSEREVAESLRAELHVRPQDTLLIDRSFQRGFFPSVAFFRARYVDPNAIDIPIQSAGAAVVGNRVFVIREAADLSALWSEAVQGRALPQSFQRQPVCGSLVVGTGLVGDGARFIQGPEEIPRRFRGVLKPQQGLHSVRSPQQRVVDGGVEVVQSVWDTDLLAVTCRLAGDNQLVVQIDTIARGYRNEP